MYTEKEWLQAKLYEFSKDEKKALLDLLEMTTDVLNQLVTDVNSKPAMSVAKSAISCNKALLAVINK